MDAEVEIQKLWEQRAKDKAAAIQDQERRHGEVMLGLNEVRAELKRVNGNIARNDRRLIELEVKEKERIRVADSRGADVGPSALPLVKIAAASGGGSVGVGLVAYMLARAAGLLP